MRSTLISVTIFLCLLGFVIYADSTLKTLCDKTIDNCVEVIDELDKNNWENALVLSHEILNTLDNSSFISSLYINHTDYDILYNEALRLSTYVEKNDTSESYTSVEMLKAYSHNIKHLHQLNIKNIF